MKMGRYGEDNRVIGFDGSWGWTEDDWMKTFYYWMGLEGELNW